MVLTNGDNEPTVDDDDASQRGTDIRPQVASRLCDLAWQLYQQEHPFQSGGVSKAHHHHHHDSPGLGVKGSWGLSRFLVFPRPAGMSNVSTASTTTTRSSATTTTTRMTTTWDLHCQASALLQPSPLTQPANNTIPGTKSQCLRTTLVRPEEDVRLIIPHKLHELFEQFVYSGNGGGGGSCRSITVSADVCQNKDSSPPLLPRPPVERFRDHKHTHPSSAVKLAAHWSTPCPHTRCWRRLRSKKKRLYYYCTFCGEKWRVPNGNSPWVPQVTTVAAKKIPKSF